MYSLVAQEDGRGCRSTFLVFCVLSFREEAVVALLPSIQILLERAMLGNPHTFNECQHAVGRIISGGGLKHDNSVTC